MNLLCWTGSWQYVQYHVWVFVYIFLVCVLFDGFIFFIPAPVTLYLCFAVASLTSVVCSHSYLLRSFCLLFYFNMFVFYFLIFEPDTCLYLCFLFVLVSPCVYRCTLWPLWTLDMIRGPAGASRQGAVARRSWWSPEPGAGFYCPR